MAPFIFLYRYQHFFQVRHPCCVISTYRQCIYFFNLTQPSLYKIYLKDNWKIMKATCFGFLHKAIFSLWLRRIINIQLASPQIRNFIYMIIIQGVPLATEPGISLIILTPMTILQRNLNSSTFVVWEMKRNVSVVCVYSAPNSSFREDWCLVWDVPAAHNWSHLLRCNHHNSCIYGNLQHLCKSIGW